MGRNKLNIIREEIKGQRLLPESLASWNSEKEPLVMLALVASGVKPGATLPAWLTTRHLQYIRRVLKKVTLPYFVRSFKPPGNKKRVWIVDVAGKKNWLTRFEKGELENGTFYGYPHCCQDAYNKKMGKPVKHPYSLYFVGLVPCKLRCQKALALAKKYDRVIADVLPQDKYRSFKKYCAPKPHLHYGF